MTPRLSDQTRAILASADTGQALRLASFKAALRAYSTARSYVARHGLDLQVRMDRVSVWAERKEGAEA